MLVVGMVTCLLQCLVMVQAEEVEKVTYSLLCMVMDGVRLSFQVGGDLDCSYEHATVGMSLGHFGWTCSASEDGSSIKRKGESIYMSSYSYFYLISIHRRTVGARM